MVVGWPVSRSDGRTGHFQLAHAKMYAIINVVLRRSAKRRHKVISRVIIALSISYIIEEECSFTYCFSNQEVRIFKAVFNEKYCRRTYKIKRYYCSCVSTFKSFQFSVSSIRHRFTTYPCINTHVLSCGRF